MNKNERIEILTLIRIIESDIRIHEDLMKDYEEKGKHHYYYFGIAEEKKDRIKYLNIYLKKLKKIYNAKYKGVNQ